jgi:hypothetical protein
LHDLEVVYSEDPWAGLRDAPATAGGPALEHAADQPLPPPVHHYRLDGSASLTRGRFLRLALSLELREPLAAEPGNRAGLTPAAGAGAPAAPPAFRVHRLEQTRSVRTGRMEYFDGPVLGVLAWVTDVSDGFADAETVTEEVQP